jgi:transcription antitermination factor NusG
LGHAYTPGLKVATQSTVRKERLLPLAGDVVVRVGQRVRASDVVARAALPGDIAPVPVANKLGVAPAELPECMLKREGDPVASGELIARTKGFFGMFKSECASPMQGSIASISKVTGQVMVQGPPVPVEIHAYLDGVVVDILPGEGAVIETQAAFVQGIFGVGGETHGTLECVVQSPADVLDTQRVPAQAKGKVLVGGSLVTYDAIVKARDCGAVAVVAGGMHDADLHKLLGYDLGVAITGNEELGITLVITEGFGQIAMADRTFKLLRSKQGRDASVNGATQIRAGVMRPEIIVPLSEAEAKAGTEASVHADVGLRSGDTVRIIREPHFGELGTIVTLPAPLQTLDSESKARVLELELANGQRLTVARANVEIIEER